MTRWMYPPELSHARERDEFDPVVQGGRHGLSREQSLAIWEHVCADATYSAARCNLEQIHARFHELAMRSARRAGWIFPDVGKVTRVGVELGRAAPGMREADEWKPGTPGRETLVAIEARRRGEADREPGMSRRFDFVPGFDTALPGHTAVAAATVPVMRSAERAEIDRDAADLVARARHGGAPLEDTLRSRLEATLGVRLDGVRVHADGAADAAARSLGARAFAIGNDVFFRAGAYDPRHHDGQRLIAHEVAHTVQAHDAVAPTAGAMTVSEPGDVAEREADAFADEFVRRAEAEAQLPVSSVAAPDADHITLASRTSQSSVQLQSHGDEAAVRARLRQVRARLAELRAQTRQSADGFADSLADERTGESLDRATSRAAERARSESAGHGLWGGFVTAASVRRCVTATQSGNTVTLSVNLQMTYEALPEDQAREHAARDMPRVAAAIRDAWQVDIQQGDYAGIQFRLVPTVTFLPHGAARASNAFVIDVRGPDAEPSAGEPVTATISLAPAHLEGARVIVVAHELAHLFGLMDTYLPSLPDAHGRRGFPWVLGRQDPDNRTDLLGMIDPAVLARLLREGAALPQDVARQRGPVHIWEEEASQVLRTLGLAPHTARPTPDSEDFDPQVELDRLRRDGEARIREIRERRHRSEESIEWLDRVEEIMRLEREERELEDLLPPEGDFPQDPAWPTSDERTA